jgi:two-component system phosphate regulon response regulator OmpR
MLYHAEKTHILVVDDDDRIRDLLRRFLLKQDFIINTAEDAEHAKEILKKFHYDLIVLDVMMPGQDGYGLTQELREQGVDIPIILLTAKGEVEDRIEGLTAGSDDYIIKPFEPKELLLRIQAVLKRTQKYKKPDMKKLQIGGWVYDRENGVLNKGDETITLTDSERNLCNLLIQNANNPVSRHDLAEKLGFADNERSVDVQITRLRKKLQDTSKPSQILKTVRGEGYMLKVEDVI